MKKLLSLFLIPSVLWAGVVRYPSGLLQTFEGEPTRQLRSERVAVAAFLRSEFSGLPTGYAWREAKVFSDHTHVHHRYQLYFQDRRVADALLKVHFNREGWVQYASNSWDLPAVPLLPSDVEGDRRVRTESLESDFVARYGALPVRLELEPVIWLDARAQNAVAAFDVTLTSERAGVFRHFFIDESDGRLLEEKHFLRHLTANVYRSNPNLEALSSQTLPVTPTSSGKLDNPYIYVQREENTITPTLHDVDATVDFHAVAGAAPHGWTASPGSYGFECVGSCPNQSFDAVNIYYHLSAYRQALATYYADPVMAVTHAFPNDPLRVIVNNLTPLQTSSGVQAYQDTATNNAALIPKGCRSDGSIDKCLIFLPPAPVLADICGRTVVDFYDLAREAVVAVHEFQHYVTDSVAGLISGSDTYNVGDAIHEGYSDYFAASQISSITGHDVTKIGEYSFQNCTALQRDVAVLLPYVDGTSTQDPHVAGLTWASGLWQLRVELGKTLADELAYKSQFFLPVKPGFIDVVESLVKADAAITQGAHTTRIRELFYNTLHFVGGQSGTFRDAGKGVAELGLHSCAGIALGVPARSAYSSLTYLLLGLWLIGTVWFARSRRWGRQR